MNETLMYFVKVNIAIALFYLFYRLFFANDTFWKTRRLYLLVCIGLSFVYPFFSVQNWLQQQEPIQEIVNNYNMLPEIVVTPTSASNQLSFENIMLIFYGLIVAVLIVRLMLQLLSIVRISLSGRRITVQNVNIIAIDKEITPFSFFGSVYMNPALHNERETKEILAHELTHVRQMHSFDVLLAELLTIVCWINPATWLLKREIRHNLEFLADNKVLESGFDSKSYQYHLLQLTYQTSNLKLTNKFNISPLKKRIIMMNQRKTSKAGMLKYLLIAPLALTLVISSNAEKLINSSQQVTKKNVEAPADKAVEKTAKTNSTNKLDEVVVVGYGQQEDQKKQLPPPPPPPPSKNDEMLPPPPPPLPSDMIFQVVETMPIFPGGEAGLFGFLGSNVRYPVKAQEKGIQGRVICNFIINTTGSIDSVKVLRSVDPDLDAEAIRVIKSMPNWTPGEQRGQKVNVKYTLPINFRLDNGKKEGFVNNPPLIVLDGVTMGKNFKVSNLKPETIDKIEVLKDASAIAIYGESGKNGVILITLKK